MPMLNMKEFNSFRISFGNVKKYMYHWADAPHIPSDNNFAERALRPMVIARKISFGSQSEKGLQTREILMTILHTASARGHDAVSYLKSLLDSTSVMNDPRSIRLSPGLPT